MTYDKEFEIPAKSRIDEIAEEGLKPLYETFEKLAYALQKTADVLNMAVKNGIGRALEEKKADHVPDIEKLAIAVKALENIIDGNDLAYERGESMASWMDSAFRRQAKDALKEIQG